MKSTPVGAATSRIDFPTLFSQSFRPFFLAALVFSIVTTALWIYAELNGIGSTNSYRANIWYYRELLFGYGGAFLAGYLLTAVKNWTSVAEIKASALGILFLLWLLARFLPYIPGDTFALLSALSEVAFFAVLTALMASALIQTHSRNSYLIIELMILITLGSILTHWTQEGFWVESVTTGIRLSLYAAMMILLVLSERVLPFQIEKMLQVSISPNKPYPVETIGSVAIYGLMIFELLFPVAWLASLLSLIAALAIGARLLDFYQRGIRYFPLLWGELSGRLWIVIGFLLHSAALFRFLPYQADLASLVYGGLGIMSAGMAVRVIQGYTEEDLHRDSDTTAAFVLLNLGTLAAVVDALFPELSSHVFFLIATLCWSLSFGFLLKAYGPLLLGACRT